jgi:hypothetical protein
LQRKGHSGLLPVSAPEATALDLIRYARHLGGLDAVITVLAELAESMTADGLATAAAAEAETAQLQRLGWLLDRVGQTDLSDALRDTLAKRGALPRTSLDSTLSRRGNTNTNRWRIIENSQPETDL